MGHLMMRTMDRIRASLDTLTLAEHGVDGERSASHRTARRVAATPRGVKTTAGSSLPLRP